MDDEKRNAVLAEFEHLPILANVGSYSLRDMQPLLADPEVRDFIELEVFSSLEYVAVEMEFEADAPGAWKKIGHLTSANLQDQADEFRDAFISLMDGIVDGYQGPTFSRSFLASVYVDVYRSILENALRHFGNANSPFRIQALQVNNFQRNRKISSDFLDENWRRHFATFVTKHGTKRAIELLAQFIERPAPLFAWTQRSGNERHMAWLFLIDLLREVGRFAEALAWTCLECELYPENVTAQSLRDELKRELKIQTPEQFIPPV